MKEDRFADVGKVQEKVWAVHAPQELYSYRHDKPQLSKNGKKLPFLLPPALFSSIVIVKI